MIQCYQCIFSKVRNKLFYPRNWQFLGLRRLSGAKRVSIHKLMADTERSLLGKYRGCLLGVLLGDCIGALYERPTSFLPFVAVADIEASVASHVAEPIPPLTYTDDTSMTLSLAESLLKNQGLNLRDLAIQFVKRFREETAKQKLYAKVREEVFEQWEATNFAGDIFHPAKIRFHGLGSNGNGGGMRAAAVALFCGKNLEQLISIAKMNTQLTHAHSEGYNGAVLQAYAVHLALFSGAVAFSEDDFLKKLRNFCETELECEEPEKPFTNRLMTVQQLLSRQNVPSSQVIGQLGHSVKAVDAIPMAVYCALRALKPIPDIENRNPFERTIIYAISMGGDTDTIASMAAAIVGALLGDGCIPLAWIRMCEASDKLLDTANALYQHITESPDVAEEQS